MEKNEIYSEIDKEISNRAGKVSSEKYGLLAGYTNEESRRGLLHCAGRVIFYNNLEKALQEAVEHVESQRKAKGVFWCGAFDCKKFNKNWENKFVAIVPLKKNFQKLYEQDKISYGNEIKRFILKEDDISNLEKLIPK